MNDFVLRATLLVRGAGGYGKRGVSISHGCAIWIRLGLIDGVIAGATSIGDRGGLWTVTVEVINFSEEEIFVTELLEDCIVDAMSKHLEFISEIGGEKNNFFSWVRRWIQDYVRSRIEGFSNSVYWFIIIYSCSRSINFEILQIDFSFIRLQW